MPHEVIYYLCFAAWLMGGFVNIVSGMGAGMMAIPVMIFILGVTDGIIASGLPGMGAALIIFFMYLRTAEWKVAIRLFCSAWPGCIVGGLTLKYLPTQVLQLGVGLLLLGCLLINRLPSYNIKITGGRASQYFFGFFSGFCQGAVFLGGPPLAAYSELRHWNPLEAKSVFAPFFAFITVFVCTQNYFLNLYTRENMYLSAWATAGLFTGTIIGYPLLKKIDGKIFSLIMQAIVFFSAIYLLIKVFV